MWLALLSNVRVLIGLGVVALGSVVVGGYQLKLNGARRQLEETKVERREVEAGLAACESNADNLERALREQAKTIESMREAHKALEGAAALRAVRALQGGAQSRGARVASKGNGAEGMNAWLREEFR